MEAQDDYFVKNLHHYVRLYPLIREKGFDAVTIGDISERAMINRSTFYRHYNDKFDLAEKCLDEPFNALLQELDQLEEKQDQSVSQAPRNFLILIGHIKENADIYRMLFGRNGISIFISRLREYIVMLLRFRLRSAVRQKKEDMIPQDMFEEFLAGAYIGVIQWWLDHITDYKVEEVALWLYRLAVEGTVATLGINSE